jgi:hypothetical protein
VRRLPGFKPGSIAEQRSRRTETAWEFFPAQPGKQPVEVHICIPDGHVAKNRASANKIYRWIAQQENKCGSIVNLRAGCAQTHICIHINEFSIHRSLERG